jgi:hypothetical protein
MYNNGQPVYAQPVMVQPMGQHGQPQGTMVVAVPVNQGQQSDGTFVQMPPQYGGNYPQMGQQPPMMYQGQGQQAGQPVMYQGQPYTLQAEGNQNMSTTGQVEAQPVQQHPQSPNTTQQ